MNVFPYESDYGLSLEGSWVMNHSEFKATADLVFLIRFGMDKNNFYIYLGCQEI